MVHFPICGIIPAFSGSFGNRDQAQIFFGFLRIEAAVPVEKERETVSPASKEEKHGRCK